MIALFSKLKNEGLLKEGGKLLDLGSGEGRFSEVFFKYGYEVDLIDKNAEELDKASIKFKKIRENGFSTVQIDIGEFDVGLGYDVIVISNVLPFIHDHSSVEKIIQTCYERLNNGGVLFFTLFGEKDQWATERKDNMSFYKKEDALRIIDREPYFSSEDYGHGITMKGDGKIWHIFHLLYVKGVETPRRWVR